MISPKICYGLLLREFPDCNIGGTQTELGNLPEKGRQSLDVEASRVTRMCGEQEREGQRELAPELPVSLQINTDQTYMFSKALKKTTEKDQMENT